MFRGMGYCGGLSGCCRGSPPFHACLGPTWPLPASCCSLEHCPGVSDEGLRHLAAGLPLLRELRLHGSGVSPGAAAQVVGGARAQRGRLPKLGMKKPCWWVQGAAGRTAADQPPAPLAAAAH